MLVRLRDNEGGQEDKPGGRFIDSNRLVMVQKQAKQVFGLGIACRLIRYPYRHRYRTDQLIRQAPR